MIEKVNPMHPDKLADRIAGGDCFRKEEAIEFINKRFRRDLSSLKTNWNLKRKVGLNNQVKMEKEMLKVVRTYVERVGENEQCQMD